jgi:hypothetical protein
MKLAADQMYNGTWAQDAKTRTDLSGGATLRRIKQSHERHQEKTDQVAITAQELDLVRG